MRSNQTGFTLIEVTTSVALFTLVGLGIIMAVSNLVTATKQQGQLSSDADQSRRFTFQALNELRGAITSSTGGYPLQEALDQEIIFYSNVDGGIDIERVRYYISSGSLYRGIVKPTGNPLTYNVGSEASTIVQRNVANGGTALFTYYNGTYNGVSGSALTQPVDVTDVSYVKINLMITNKAGKSTSTNTYTVTAGGSLRNLKVNLGN